MNTNSQEHVVTRDGSRPPSPEQQLRQLRIKVPRRGGLAPWQSRRVTVYVREHIGMRLKTSDLAKLVQLSITHFHRAFKVSFQETPAAYIMRQRMRLAQDLMLATGHPLSWVAMECGLCDQAHFSRVFRRLSGQSPSLWRRQFASASRERESSRANAIPHIVEVM